MALEERIAAWQQKRAAVLDAGAAQRLLRKRRVQAALACFAATALLGTRIHWHATLAAGVLCALWWRRSSACRFRDPISALVCLGALQLLTILVHDAPNPGLFLDAMWITVLATVIGFEGEIRRTGGFAVR